MSTPWTSAVSQWTVAGFYNRKYMNPDAVLLLLSVSSAEERDAVVQGLLNQMTEFYRRKLTDRFKRSYPQTARKMMSYALGRFIEAKKYLSTLQSQLGADDPWGVQNGFPVSQLSTGQYPAPYSTIVDSYWYDLHPRPPFPISGVPVDGASGTLAGQANNGDFCADMSFEALYINRGTLASPVWVRWRIGGVSNTSDHPLIDYLNNPQELLECGYQRLKFYIRDYATDADDGQFAYRLENMPKAAKLAKDRATEEEELSFALIEVDESADGILSDYELEMTSVSEWVA